MVGPIGAGQSAGRAGNRFIFRGLLHETGPVPDGYGAVELTLASWTILPPKIV